MKLGVDVSEHQAGLDVSAFDFVVARTTDGTHHDECFASFAPYATAAYHFLRAPSEGTSIAEQVAAALEVLGERRVPVWIDVESPAGLSLHDVRSAHHAFTSAGIQVAGVYTNAWYWRKHMLLADVSEFGALWLADWRDNPVVDACAPIPDPGAWPRPWGMPAPAVWQFTSRGRAGGAEVDLNLAR